MRAKAEYPTVHGAQHMPDGSDPLPKVPIYYDFLNVGDWLSIETTAARPATGFGIELKGNTDTGGSVVITNAAEPLEEYSFGGGVTWITDGAGISISATSGGGNGNVVVEAGDVSISAEGTSASLQLLADTGGFNFQTTGQAAMGASQWDFNSSVAGINFISAQAVTLRAQGTGLIDLRMASGQLVRIRDAAGNSLFEVRDDQTFHILTGATWIADL